MKIKDQIKMTRTIEECGYLKAIYIFIVIKIYRWQLKRKGINLTSNTVSTTSKK